MNTTRLLSTLAAAAALTGGIGLAYAQTSSDSSKPTAAPMATPSSGSMSSTAPATTGSSTTSTTEPLAKADRG